MVWYVMLVCVSVNQVSICRCLSHGGVLCVVVSGCDMLRCYMACDAVIWCGIAWRVMVCNVMVWSVVWRVAMLWYAMLSYGK